MMTRLIFIRHGQTIGDVEDRYGGAYDDLLSPLGQQQVEDLAHELVDMGIEQIFVSSLKRAQQTAEGIANLVKCPVITLPDLRERDSNGPMSGLTKVEARARYPEFVELVKDRLNTIPGAESYADASARMRCGYDQVMAQTRACSAIVWHGGGMRVLFRDILKMGELDEIGDCAWVELEQSAPNSGFVIRQLKRLTCKF